MTITCQPEPFPHIVDDIKALIDPHWDEVGSFKEEFDRDIDWPSYMKHYHDRRLMCVTARKDGRMFGYFVGVYGHDVHRTHKGTHTRVKALSALVYYVTPEMRGHAPWLMRRVEREAKAAGCAMVNVRAKPLNNAGRFLEAIGYEPVETTYTKLV